MAVAVGATLSACSGPAVPRSAPAPSAHPGTSGTPPATTAAAGSTTTSRPACTNLAVIDRWPVARRSARLVVAPVLDFGAAAMRAAVSAGAGGMVLLGTAAAPADLAARIRGAGVAPAAAGGPLVMADEEGGGVQRLQPAVASFAWPRDLARTMTPAQVEALAASVGRQMLALGVDVDLAPVLDVDGGAGPSASNPDGARSFSGNPSVVAAYGRAFVRGLTAAGVLSVVKHFPGLGGATGNTDVGPASTRPIATLRTVALPPVRSAIDAGAPAVMVADASVPGLTAAPASLSPAVIGGLLRGQLGFRGLVITDSLSSGAVAGAGFGVEAAAVAAVEAGADMVMFGSTINGAQARLLAPAEVASTVRGIAAAVAGAVASGALPVTRLDDAVVHVLAAEHANLCAGG